VTLSGSLRRLLALVVVVVVPSTSPSIALGQGATIGAEDAQVLRAALLSDLETMRGKFMQLAEAFPQDKYAWTPMEGVRSVAQVLVLAAGEGYSFIPGSFGGQRANLTQAERQEMQTLTDKAKIMAHMEKGFAHAKSQLESIDAATLGSARDLFGQRRTAPSIALFVFGDLHEHLGQLIAYARMNHIVPPWSK